MSSFTNTQDNKETTDASNNKETTATSNFAVDVVAIALDSSGSMQGILETVVNEGIGVLTAMNPKEVVFCEFSSTYDCNLTNLEQAKLRMKAARADGGTAMYDGVTTMLNELITMAEQEKKVIAIIITDGMENSSLKYTKKDLEDAKSKLRELAGDECIREICIGSNMSEAKGLMNATPGLSRDTSAPATRNLRSITNAFRVASCPEPSKYEGERNTEDDQEDVFNSLAPPGITRSSNT